VKVLITFCELGISPQELDGVISVREPDANQPTWRLDSKGEMLWINPRIVGLLVVKELP